MDSKINLTEKHLVFNNSIQLVAEFYYTYSSNAKVVYEVVRVKDSTPIFIDLHLDRLWNSLKLMRLLSPSRNQVLSNIKELLLKNPVIENNIRISLIYDLSSLPNVLIYFIPSTYPTENQRANGVSIRTLDAHRDNPNAKVENKSLRETANRIIAETNCFEVLLVNEEGLITEGSRTNVFFIKDNTFYTTPLSIVLGGITRLVVIEIINKLGLSLVETPVNIDRVNEFDAAFLTGTSPSILPISEIDDLKYNTNHSLVNLLITDYNKRVQDDIDSWI